MQNYLKVFFSVAIILLLPVYIMGLFLQPLSGDLTRIGGFAENDFGWNDRQPKIVIRDNNTLSPDIIVIGDSFSKRNIWQSIVMERTGLSILSLRAPHPMKIGQFLIACKKHYPTVRYIILECVERGFISRFAREESPAIRKISLTPVIVQESTTLSQRNITQTFQMPDALYSAKSIINRYRKFGTKTCSNGAVVVPLNTSELFSSKRSNSLLYYAEDDFKANWSKVSMHAAVSKIKALNEMLEDEGITLIMMVIPDKSTAYQAFLENPQFSSLIPDIWAELNMENIQQVDMKDMVTHAVSKYKDFYFPNDTHFGVHGYVLTGNCVAQKILDLAQDPTIKKRPRHGSIDPLIFSPPVPPQSPH